MAVRTRHDRGAVSIEYIGVGVAIIALLGAMFITGVAAKAGDAFEYTFCKAASVVDGRACSMGSSDGGEPGDPTKMSPRERAESGDYVALGDSYISGEGAGSYLDGTNFDANEAAKDERRKDMNPFEKAWDSLPGGDDEDHSDESNYCHRSDNSWASGVHSDGNFKGDFTFGACSGATTKDYWNENGDNDGEKPQRELIDEDTSLITLSMGGNDAGFSSVIENCVSPFGNGCGSEKSDEVKADIDKAAEDLIKVYLDMREKSPNARIIVAGYPRMFPVDDDDANGGDSGVSRDEQRWVNEMGEYANGKIREAAENSGADIEFVDISNALDGHEIGSDDPWMNDLDVGFGGADSSGASVESFHPKKEGHNAIQALIDAQIDQGP